MTADDDQKQSIHQYNEEACYVIDSLEQIGSQWRLIVLHDLQTEDDEKRFNELKRSTGASSRTLSRVLDDLQEMGFVTRRLEEDAPVATYYGLTEKGISLCPVFDEIERWAEEWIGESLVETDAVRSD
jgi:DNA-binding HxlR family transcriptional regulator